MKKFINILITIILAVIYMPVILLCTVWMYINLMLARRRNGKPLITIWDNVDKLNSVSPRNTVTIGDYEIINLPTTSLVGLGLAFTVFDRKIIYTGMEFNKYSSALQKYIVLHEIGHHEHPHGMSHKKILWNPDDMLSPTPAGVLAEIAADQYALANGADKWVITKFLGRNLLISPINMLIRIYMVWRYKA